MTDDFATSPTPGEQQGGSRRLRTALAIVLVFLIVLLGVLGLFIWRVLEPVGAPDAADTGELEWVRSIYGWGRTEDEQLYAPSDVAIGPDGTIWVCDSQRFQVVGFNPDGSYRTLVHQGPGYMFPQAMTVSEDNELYIGDYLNAKVRVFSPDNEELRSWDTSAPSELDVKGDRVVVGSVENVTVYDTQGALITRWGAGRSTGTEQFDVVRGVAIGPDDRIYLSDTQNHRIKCYDMEGNLQWVYPSPEEFEQMADDENIDKPFQIPAGMTFDGAGRLVLVDPFEFTMMVIDTENGHVLETYGEFGEDDGKFLYPTSLSYDPDRDWFAVADTSNDRVQIVRIPGSGGNLLAALRRAWTGPLWVCGIPLALLVLAAVVAIIARRRSKMRAAAAGDESVLA